MTDINFTPFYEVTAADAGYEVVPDPSGNTDYFIFRARNWAEDSALCDTEKEAWRECCLLNALKVDFKLDDFTRQFIQCALSTENDESDDSGGEPLDSNYDIEDIDIDSMEKIIVECAEIQETNQAQLKKAYARYKVNREQGDTAAGMAGWDFLLTRNGHGVGFSDRDLGAAGERLSEIARDAGAVHLYLGDDGRVHTSIDRPFNSKPGI